MVPCIMVGETLTIAAKKLECIYSNLQAEEFCLKDFLKFTYMAVNVFECFASSQ